MQSCFQKLHTFARTVSPLLSHVIDRGPANRPPCAFSALYISQQCSREFLHLVWANKTHFLQLLRGSHKSDALHLGHSSGLVKQCLYTPNISDECQCSGVHSSLLMRRNILDVSDICVDFICNEGSFIHSSKRRGRGWERTVACSQQLRLAHYRMELNKFFLLETLSNKSFPTSPMNTLAASLID